MDNTALVLIEQRPMSEAEAEFGYLALRLKQSPAFAKLCPERQAAIRNALHEAEQTLRQGNAIAAG